MTKRLRCGVSTCYGKAEGKRDYNMTVPYYGNPKGLYFCKSHVKNMAAMGSCKIEDEFVKI